MLERTGDHQASPVKVAGIEFFEKAAVFADPAQGSGLSSRFVISDESFIRSTYNYAAARLDEVAACDPAVVGATAFGSTTKGYARSGESDLDLTVFVDLDQLGIAVPPVVDADPFSWNPWRALEGKSTKFVGDKYQNFVRDNLNYLLPCDDVLPINPGVFPINHDLMVVLAGFDKAKAATNARYYQLLAETPHTPIDEIADWATIPIVPETLRANPALAEALAAGDERDEYFDILTVIKFLGKAAAKEDTELAYLRTEVVLSNRLGSDLPLRLFGLSLSPNMQPYRQTFLDALSDTPDPDQTWDYFCGRLKRFEDSVKHPRDVNLLDYPRTMDEAIKLYA